MAKLHDAAAKGDLAQVAALLDAGADVNAKTLLTRNTPLALAINGGHTAVVKLLLDRGADQGIFKGRSDSFLAGAFTQGRTDLVFVLLDHGCGKPNDALHFAVHCQQPELVTAMLDRGAKVDGKNANGNTFLMQAAWDKNTEIVRILLDHGANINASKDGATPLHFAFTPSEKPPTRELVELLLQRGADVNARMKGTDMTPLWGAWVVDDRKLRLELMKLLLEHGADVNIRLVDAKRILAERLSLGKVSEEALLGVTLLETIQEQEPDDVALISLLQNWKPRQSAPPPSPNQPNSAPQPRQAKPTSPPSQANPVSPPPVAATISFQCGACSKSLKAPLHAAGKTTKCPKCSQPIVVPAAGG